MWEHGEDCLCDTWAFSSHCLVAFQGSEEHTVAYVVGKAGRQHWQHVYTAVTRGRCKVYIIAQESQLQSAIRKPNILRQTRLKHFLQNELSVRSASPEDQPSQPASSGDSGGPNLPEAPLAKNTTVTITDDVAKNQSSSTNDRMASDMDTDEDLSSQGPKRTSGVKICDSPSKVSKVGVMLGSTQI